MNQSPEILKAIKLPAKKIVCAVSGGVDSMLLLARCALHPWPVVAAHVNYAKRGEASDLDERHVVSCCRAYGIPCFVHHAKPEELKGNFQESARELRYRFFEEVRQASEASAVLTAHHADDESESMLLQLFRSGDSGNLRGIHELKNNVVRPMLGLSRDEILNAARECRLEWREDESNSSAAYTRNRIRHEIIPVLNDLFPGWKERFGKQTDFNRTQDNLVNGIINLITLDNKIKFSALNSFNAENRQKILGAWIFRQAGFHTNQSVISAVQQLFRKQTGSRVQLGLGYEVIRERQELLLLNQQSTIPEPLASVSFDRSEISTTSAVRLGENNFQLAESAWDGKPELLTLELREDALLFPLRFRYWKAGDRMNPLGMRGSKLVSDILTDQKVPSWQKKQAVVVQSFDGKIAAVIFPMDVTGKAGLIAAHAACTQLQDKSIKIKRIK